MLCVVVCVRFGGWLVGFLGFGLCLLVGFLGGLE